MTEATFEDFLDLAADRLDRATLAVADGTTVGAATCAALSAVTRSLIALSTRYGLLPSGIPAAAWQPAVVERLTAADRAFRRHGRPDASPSAADAKISDAARLLTVAQDLLATHLTTPDPPRQFARTPQGEQLLDAPVRDHLLRRAAAIADQLAALTRIVLSVDDLTRRRPHLEQAYRPRGKDLALAASELADAAAQCPAPTTARLELLPAPVLATSVTYPSPDEDPVHAAEQTRDALRRIATAAYQAAHALRSGEYPPQHTAGDLYQTATHLAVAHTIAAELLTRISPHLPAHAEWNWAEAAARLRASGAAWLRLRRAWGQTVSVPDSGPRSPLTVQATSLVIRLGRLAYDDPAWSPHAGPGHPRGLGELLVPDVLDALCVTISALPCEAAVIAANHARLITDGVLDLHSPDRAHRPDSEGRRFFPLQPAQRAELAVSYRDAASASKTAAADLADLGRGYRTLKEVVVTFASRRTARPSPERMHRQAHQKPRQQERPDGERPIIPKR
ncbi:hypothetical protein KGA66_23465 [Actinocrinis puniceicyclus]|uniref:Uncharacterized protein n=1 Tax=Actinocrinis puniceicyclus TaxID=977794 RepID=A0A8J8BE60_9ACTN|nr:hypothetical protein [Actinocrinis puniceicyclus]MBS2966023.1 hypothetical protein [Actinocrinis puniceicyclus]